MPKKTTALITEQGCDYVIGVKKNQPKLYERVAEIMSESQHYSSYFVSMHNNKGRAEIRKVCVSNHIGGISDEWLGLTQLIKVERTVKSKKRNSYEDAYYISSKNSNALQYVAGIREHWGIENGLHYVKDVTQREDYSKIATGEAPQNLSTIKNMAINIMRLNGYTNIASATRLLANDIQLVMELIE